MAKRLWSRSGGVRSVACLRKCGRRYLRSWIGNPGESTESTVRRTMTRGGLKWRNRINAGAAWSYVSSHGLTCVLAPRQVNRRRRLAILHVVAIPVVRNAFHVRKTVRVDIEHRSNAVRHRVKAAISRLHRHGDAKRVDVRGCGGIGE